jgi:hypothetical protein
MLIEQWNEFEMTALNCQVVLNPESSGRVSRTWIGVEDREFGCKVVLWSAMFRSSQVQLIRLK